MSESFPALAALLSFPFFLFVFSRRADPRIARTRIFILAAADINHHESKRAL